MLLLTSVADAPWSGLEVVHESCLELNQHDRIIEALGAWGEHLPRVDEETLSRYYQYLSARLSFPFIAHYPQPRSSLEEVQHRGIVLELLDPTKYVGDEFDGILCKTRKGKYEVNLPLIELEISEDSPDFQLIEDYWYWFWNCR
jgi:hypothetical protein